MKYPIQFKLLVVLICYFVFFNVNAQENYTSGHIINLKGKKINGFLKFKKGSFNPTDVLFKKTLQGTAVNYSTTEIKGFKANKYSYVSANVSIEGSSRQTNKLEENSKLNLSNKVVFLQNLYVDKVKSLYSFTSKYGVRNFYIFRDHGYQLLRYKKYLYLDGGTMLIRENKQYLGQLKQYLSECDLKDSKFKNIRYHQNSLISLFEKYAACTNTKSFYKKEDVKMRFDVGVIVGGAVNSLRFTEGPSNFNYLVNADFKASSNMTVGAYIELASTQTSKWSWNNEFLYMSYDIKGHHEKVSSSDNYVFTDTYIGYSQLKFNSLIRYKFPVAKLHLFVNGGISNGFTLSELNNSKTIREKYFTNETIEEGIAVLKTRSYEQGFLLGAGVKYKNISFETRFESGNGMSSMSRVNSKVSRMHFLCAYQF